MSARWRRTLPATWLATLGACRWARVERCAGGASPVVRRWIWDAASTRRQRRQRVRGAVSLRYYRWTAFDGARERTGLTRSRHEAQRIALRLAAMRGAS